MLISYEIAEGAQLRTGSLKRSFVVQNKLHGRQNNACGAEKMCLEEKRHSEEKCEFFRAIKQPAFMMIRALEEGNGCFVASDW